MKEICVKTAGHEHERSNYEVSNEKHYGEKQALQRALSQTGEMLVSLQIIFAE